MFLKINVVFIEMSGLFKPVKNLNKAILNFQLDNAYSQVVKPLEDFRKKYIGGVKNEKKRFDKQTAKFCQCQERYLNMTTKKPNSLQEVSAVMHRNRLLPSPVCDFFYFLGENSRLRVANKLTFSFTWKVSSAAVLKHNSAGPVQRCTFVKLKVNRAVFSNELKCPLHLAH